MHPVEIQRLGTEGVEVRWSDGKSHQISSSTLRGNCPSADSKAKRGDTSHDKPLSGKSRLLQVVESSIEEELRLEKIWQVGNYALGIRWGDGHDSGIYTFSFLYDLGESEGQK